MQELKSYKASLCSRKGEMEARNQLMRELSALDMRQLLVYTKVLNVKAEGTPKETAQRIVIELFKTDKENSAPREGSKSSQNNPSQSRNGQMPKRGSLEEDNDIIDLTTPENRSNSKSPNPIPTSHSITAGTRPKLNEPTELDRALAAAPVKKKDQNSNWKKNRNSVPTNSQSEDIESLERRLSQIAIQIPQTADKVESQQINAHQSNQISAAPIIAPQNSSATTSVTQKQVIQPISGQPIVHKIPNAQQELYAKQAFFEWHSLMRQMKIISVRHDMESASGQLLKTQMQSRINQLAQHLSIYESQFQPNFVATQLRLYNEAAQKASSNAATRPIDLTQHSRVSAATQPAEPEDILIKSLYQRIQQTKITEEPSPENQPKELKIRLLPYQLQGLEWLKKNESASASPKGGLLCDDMGLGKTVKITVTILIWTDPDPFINIGK